MRLLWWLLHRVPYCLGRWTKKDGRRKREKKQSLLEEWNEDVTNAAPGTVVDVVGSSNFFQNVVSAAMWDFSISSTKMGSRKQGNDESVMMNIAPFQQRAPPSQYFWDEGLDSRFIYQVLWIVFPRFSSYLYHRVLLGVPGSGSSRGLEYLLVVVLVVSSFYSSSTKNRTVVDSYGILTTVFARPEVKINEITCLLTITGEEDIYYGATWSEDSRRPISTIDLRQCTKSARLGTEIR